MTTLPQLRDRAVDLHRAGKLDEAARAYAAFLAQVPGDAAIWSNLGALHRTAGRHRMALRCHRRALAVDPGDTGVRNNLANVLSDIGYYDESIALRQELLKRRPDDLQHLAMIGRCHRGKGDYAAAIAHLTAARLRFPADAELQMQLAFAQLGAGDYAAGLANYAARWRAGELPPREIDLPEWDGEADIRGKTIAVLPEQGFGDAILFARFLPVLRATGARVVLLCKRPLWRLFERLEGVDALAPDLPAAGADCWVNMMDLALYHFRQDGAVPPPARLHLPDAAVDRARAIAAPHRDRFKVGVVWTGSVTYKGNAFRSFSHRDLLPLADLPGVQLFSLYKGPELAAFYADGADSVIVDSGASESDFADCAAMMKEMDLVITSDTATAHLAGSLGLPAWVVLHWDAFWVWRHAGDATAWYPGLRLFRQKLPLDWSSVMPEVEAALRNVVGRVP